MTLKTGGISWLLVSIHASEICIRITIDLEYLPFGIQDNSTTPGQFQILTDSLQSLSMLMLGTKHISCKIFECKGNVRTCVAREVEHNYYGAAVVKANTGRDTILILD